jgi:hypothetical protein
MARTPLLHALQQLAHDFGTADDRNISVEEVQERRRSPSKQISRRDLLKGAGVIATGIALAPSFDPLPVICLQARSNYTGR